MNSGTVEACTLTDTRVSRIPAQAKLGRDTLNSVVSLPSTGSQDTHMARSRPHSQNRIEGR